MVNSPGGFWIRFVALLVDTIIMTFLSLPVTIVSGLIFGFAPTGEAAKDLTKLAFTVVCQLIIYLFYLGWFYKNKGATPGKLIFGLKVIDIKSEQYIDYSQTFRREILGKFVDALTLGIGYLIAAFRDDKRALHDFIGGTRVIRERSVAVNRPESDVPSKSS